MLIRLIGRPRVAGQIAVCAAILASCNSSPEGLVWKYRSSFSILPASFVFITMSRPAIVGDRAVFCGGDGSHREGHLGALRLQDGAPLWKWTVGACFGAPLIVNDSMAVGWGSQPDHMAMVAVRIRDGVQQWRRELPRDFQYVAPVAFGDSIYLPLGPELHRVSVQSGGMDHVGVEGCPAKESHAWAVADAGRMLFGCGSRVYELARGAPAMRFLFEVDVPLSYADHFTVDDKVLYIADRGSVSKLVAIDLTTGHTLWKRDMPIADAPAVVRNMAYVADGFTLHALDKTTGQPRWQTAAQSSERPLFYDGALFIPDYRSVVKLDPGSGRTLRRYAAAAEVVTTPVAVADKLLYGDLKGFLYAVRR